MMLQIRTKSFQILEQMHHIPLCHGVTELLVEKFDHLSTKGGGVKHVELNLS